MNILALDFDGVICDSAAETALVGWNAAAVLWPGLFTTGCPAQVVEKFMQVRPVLETGYESVLLVRLIRNGCRVTDILDAAPGLMAGVIRDTGIGKADLVRVFSQVRDSWMADDRSGWIGRHRFYDGVAAALNRSKGSTFIITTKQRRFAFSLCEAAGLKIPEDHIFGLESGDKLQVLRRLSRRHNKACFHFVEDRLPTLTRVAEGADFDVRLYLAQWGYNTVEERHTAAAMPHIEVLTLKGFSRLAGRL